MPISEKSPSGLNRELLQREAGDDISREGTQCVARRSMLLFQNPQMPAIIKFNSTKKNDRRISQLQTNVRGGKCTDWQSC